jgi:uncharacterized protein
MILLLSFLAQTLLLQPAPIEISILVRDGNYLAADLYLNNSISYPLIVIQTPYNRKSYRIIDAKNQIFLFNENYNFLIVDWRGFYGSKDTDIQGYDRGLDGYDIIEWAAQQDWCNGRIGTYGGSALGFIQFQTARLQPPHLVCASPWIKDFKAKYSDYYYGGVLRTEQVTSLVRLGFTNMDAIIRWPNCNQVWDALENSSDYPETFNVPFLMVTGWFDHYPDDVIRAFNDIQTRSNIDVRKKHKLIIGPWTHGEIDQAEIGELTFSNALGVADSAALKFFDYYLLGIENGYPSLPIVKYYQLGVNEWRQADNWDNLPKVNRKLYLNTGGLLSFDYSASEAHYTFDYDPHNPSPSVGGQRFNPFDRSIIVGPRDQRFVVESRGDVVVFTSEPFPISVDIIGKTEVELYFKSNRLDTDVSVRLCDVYPDGRSMLMTDGIERLRFRDGCDKEQLLVPDSIYRVIVELQNLALTFLPGHSLRIIISSSNYPRFDNNLNNGQDMYTLGDTLIATNTILTGAEHPSNVTLTVKDYGDVIDGSIINNQLFKIRFNSSLKQINIEYSISNKPILIDLFSLKGELIIQKTVYTNTENNVDVSKLAKGVYFISVSNSSGNYTQKLLIM